MFEMGNVRPDLWDIFGKLKIILTTISQVHKICTHIWLFYFRLKLAKQFKFGV